MADWWGEEAGDAGERRKRAEEEASRGSNRKKDLPWTVVTDQWAAHIRGGLEHFRVRPYGPQPGPVY